MAWDSKGLYQALCCSVDSHGCLVGVAITIPILSSHIPNMPTVGGTSDIVQNDAGNDLGLDLKASIACSVEAPIFKEIDWGPQMAGNAQHIAAI